MSTRWKYKHESSKLIFRKSSVFPSTLLTPTSLRAAMLLHQFDPFPSSLLLLAFLLLPYPYPTTPSWAPFWLCQVPWLEGAWHGGGQRPSVLIRGVWHHGTALPPSACCLLESVPRHCVQQQPGVRHQSRPSWLAGWRGLLLTCSGAGGGGGVKYTAAGPSGNAVWVRRTREAG